LLNSKNTQKIEFSIQNKKVENPEKTGTVVSMLIPVNFKYNI
jgi:hypothetical protein